MLHGSSGHVHYGLAMATPDKKLQHEAVLVCGAVIYNPCCQVDRADRWAPDLAAQSGLRTPPAHSPLLHLCLEGPLRSACHAG